MRPRIRLTTAVLLAVFAATARAQDPVPPISSTGGRPKIGIAFAGGGARGGAHVGVLKVLEEMRVPVDYVAGTSIGSIIAALYASGMSPDEMETVLATTDWDAALQDDQPRKDQPYRQKEDDALYLIRAELGFHKRSLVLPGGLVAGQKLNYLLRRFTLPASNVTDFDRLRIPFRCVATDIVTGAKVVLDKGDLARAVRASMAIPGFFSPVQWEDKLLTDGGTADNMPVDVVRAMGADIVIAIDISTPLKKRDEISSFLSITGQTSGFLTRLNVEQQIATLTKGHDVLVTPNLDAVSTLDFKQFPKASEQGRIKADEMRAEFARFSVSEAEYTKFLEKQRDKRVDPAVEEVRVEAPPGVDSRLLKGRIRTKPGKVDWPLLERDLARLYELGDYETVDFHIATEGGKKVLVLGGAPRPPAPTRLRFGLKLDTDFAANSSFGLRLGVYFTRLNALRGELRTKVEVGRQNSILFEFYQPTDYAGRFFVSPTVSFTRLPRDVFVQEENVARLRTDVYAGALDVGMSFGRYGEVRLGAVRADTNFKTEIFSGQPTSGSADTAALRLRAVFDQLDSATFPRDGWKANAEVFEAFDSAGGDARYGKLKAQGGFAKSFGETTVTVAGTADVVIGPDARPLYDQALLGGFLNLSGLAPGQLFADNAFVAKLLGHQRLARMNSFLGTGVYAGFSIETGNAWNSGLTFSDLRLAGSVYLAADTSLGPLFLAFGLADGGFHSFYLALGLPLN
jgi:NTE family protein